MAGPDHVGAHRLPASGVFTRVFWRDALERAVRAGAAAGEITYEVIVHDGTWSTIIGQVEEVYAEAARARAAGEKPVVLAVDSGSQLWAMLKTWGGTRSKGSFKHQRLLAFDPNAEIRIPNNIWDDIHARHARLMDLLTTFPGIAIITARGRERILNDDAADPVPKMRSYKVDCQSDLPNGCTAWVRLAHDAPPTIIGAKSKLLKIRHGKDEGRVVPDLTLEALIFQMLGCSADSQPRHMVQLGGERLPEQIRDDALATTDRRRLLELLTEAAHPVFAGVTVDNEFGAEELLTEMITRRGRGVSGRPPQDYDGEFEPEQAPPHPAQSPQAPPAPEAAPPVDQPKPPDTISQQLLNTLQQMLAVCGVTTPDERLMVMQLLTGKRLVSSHALTNELGGTLIAALGPVIASPTPRDALQSLMAERLTASMSAQTPTGPAQERPAA